MTPLPSTTATITVPVPVSALLEPIQNVLRQIAYDDPGVVAIGVERARVMDKVADPEHDAREHVDGAMVDAAICYLLGHGYANQGLATDVALLWPWDAEDFKPGSTGDEVADRIRDLTRAGQLIAAELTRLQSITYRLPLET